MSGAGVRAAVLAVGVVTGLAVAVVVGGRVDHLRRFAPGLLPDWATRIDSGASLWSGQGVVGGAALRWTLTAVDLSGPRWTLAVGGTGWQVQGEVRLAAGGVRAAGLAGVLDAGVLGPGWSGLVAIDDGAWRIALPSGDLRAARLDGQARSLRQPGIAEVADGAVTLTASAGGWQVMVGR